MIALGARWVRFALHVTLLLSSILSASSGLAIADPLFQRMRIPVGQYWIGGGGGGDGNAGTAATTVRPLGFDGVPTSGIVSLETYQAVGSAPGYLLPGYCIDEGRTAPNSTTRISYFSGNIQVHQYRGGVLVASKSINEAISGPEPWLKISGRDRKPTGDDRGSATSIAVFPLNSESSYRLAVEDLAIAGEAKDDVEQAASVWRANSDLMAVSRAFDALRSALLTGSSGSQAIASQLELERRVFEWEEFGNRKAGARVPPTGVNLQEARISFANMLKVNPFSRQSAAAADARRDAIALLRGSPLESEPAKQLIAALKPIGVEVAEGNYHLSDSERRVLAAYPNLLASSPVTLTEFHRLRARQYFAFSRALYQAAFDTLGEPTWTSGAPELERFAALRCPDQYENAERGMKQNAPANREFWVAAIELARALGNYNEAMPVQRLVKASSRGGEICFEQISNDGYIISKKVAADKVTREYVGVEFGRLQLVVNKSDEGTVSLLTARGIQFERSDNVERKLQTSGYAGVPAASKQSDVRLVHFRRKLADTKGLDITTLNLETRGDALVVHAPDGSLLVVDTGIGKGTLAKLTDVLQRKYGEQRPPLRLVITHTHEDHIGGLKAIAEAGFPIQELLIGRSRSDGSGIDDLKTLFDKGLRRDVAEPGAPGVTHYVEKGVNALFRPGDRRLTSGGAVESWTIYGLPELIIDIHHVVQAKDPNDGGLLVRIAYRGMRWLLCDDLSSSSLAIFAGAAELPSGIDIRAGSMKWPHHLWLPGEKDVAARKALTAFLQKASPHTIIFSNVGHRSHDKKRFAAIKKFIEGSLGIGVITKWTRENNKNVIIEAEHRQIRLSSAWLQ